MKPRSWIGLAGPVLQAPGCWRADLHLITKASTMDARIKKWAELAGCAGSASSTNSDGCSACATCQDDAELVLGTKQGGGDELGDASIAWPVLTRHTRRP